MSFTLCRIFLGFLTPLNNFRVSNIKITKLINFYGTSKCKLYTLKVQPDTKRLSTSGERIEAGRLEFLSICRRRPKCNFGVWRRDIESLLSLEPVFRKRVPLVILGWESLQCQWSWKDFLGFKIWSLCRFFAKIVQFFNSEEGLQHCAKLKITFPSILVFVLCLRANYFQDLCQINVRVCRSHTPTRCTLISTGPLWTNLGSRSSVTRQGFYERERERERETICRAKVLPLICCTNVWFAEEWAQTNSPHESRRLKPAKPTKDSKRYWVQVYWVQVWFFLVTQVVNFENKDIWSEKFEASFKIFFAPGVLVGTLLCKSKHCALLRKPGWDGRSLSGRSKHCE